MDRLGVRLPRPVRMRSALTRLAVAGLLSGVVATGGALTGTGAGPGGVGAEAAVRVDALPTVTATPALAAAAARPAAVQMYPAIAPGHYEERVQHWVNVKRKQHDLRRLRFAGCTDSAAERWSGYLAKNNLFYHQSMSDLLDRCDAMYAGETLGRGAVSPKRLVKLWMHSPDHRHVLLSPKSRRIGIGAKPDALGRWVVAANFMRF